MTEEKLICPSCNHGFSMERMTEYLEEKRLREEFQKECVDKLAKIKKWENWIVGCLVFNFLIVISIMVGTLTRGNLPDWIERWGWVAAFSVFFLLIGGIIFDFIARQTEKHYFADWKKQRYPQQIFRENERGSPLFVLRIH